ncbi:MAG TPA: MFS transporter [Tepidisphaeraceae bacterium]|jgi:MFS family permease
MESPSPSKLSLILRAFRHRNYRLFFAGQLVSLIGTFLTQLATVWFVYRLTHAAWLLGVAGFAGQIPMFCLAPFAGVWVDRWNRQRLLIITQILSMLQSFGLAVLAFWYPNVAGIILLSFVQGLINAFDMPGRQAFLVEMVTDRQDLANAIALNSTMVHTARLIGPAIAGLLIAIVGEGWCFTLDGISYIGVIAALWAMRIVPRDRKPTGRSALHELREGITYVWNFFPVRVLLLLSAAVSLTGMPALSVLMPIYADHFATHGKGAEVLGILMGASGLGALVGAISLASRKTVVGLARLSCYSAAIFGAVLIAFAWSRFFWLSILLVPFAGFGMLMLFAGVNTLLQTLVEDDKRGRVMSLFSMAFVGMTPWGNLMAGLFAQHAGRWSATPLLTGAAITITAAGAVCLIAAGVFGKTLPIIRSIVRPIYVKKGIIPEIAGGLQQSTNLDMPATSQS